MNEKCFLVINQHTQQYFKCETREHTAKNLKNWATYIYRDLQERDNKIHELISEGFTKSDQFFSCTKQYETIF